jgi:hypothetical protein
MCHTYSRLLLLLLLTTTAGKCNCDQGIKATNRSVRHANKPDAVADPVEGVEADTSITNTNRAKLLAYIKKRQQENKEVILLLASGENSYCNICNDNVFTIDADVYVMPDATADIANPKEMNFIPSNSIDIVVGTDAEYTYMKEEFYLIMHRILKTQGQLIMQPRWAMGLSIAADDYEISKSDKFCDFFHYTTNLRYVFQKEERKALHEFCRKKLAKRIIAKVHQWGFTGGKYVEDGAYENVYLEYFTPKEDDQDRVNDAFIFYKL